MLYAFESSTGGPLPALEDINQNCSGQPEIVDEPQGPIGVSIVQDPFDETKAVGEIAADVQPNAFFFPLEDEADDMPCPWRDMVEIS